MNIKPTSFIYEDFSQDSDLESMGWFLPKEDFVPINRNVNYVKYFGETPAYTPETLVAYFPGAFTEFHPGHLDVVEQAVKACRAAAKSYVVVIAPANSDYTVEKYGKDSLHATNKYRYDRICKMLENIDGNVAIDLNPMLNFKTDHNFTDLLRDFILRQGLNYNELRHTPKIICGKDRGYFQNLASQSNKINVLFVKDTTGFSSSSLIKNSLSATQKKKNLLLRCENKSQYDLFCYYFSDQYNEITLQLISDEIEAAKKLHAIYNFDYTICKDYAGFLPYVKVHRIFENPLADPVNYYSELPSFEGKKVLDSDIFSGGTKNFIARQNGKCYSTHDFSDSLETAELLDICDFYKPDFCYPFVDISSRCSMQPFDVKFHKCYSKFRKDIKRRM